MGNDMKNAVLNRFTGRHIVVSGAGTGIGRAIAERLWAEGAALTLLARDASRLEETALACQAQRMGDGSELGYASCDVREREALDTVLATAAAERGELHAFVANAGVGGSNGDGPDDRFDELVSVNLTGTYNSFRAAQKHLANAKYGARHLLAISSILARIGVPGYTGYCASKTGILGLVRALAAELAAEEIQVNAICPGWVDTSMARDGIDGMAQGMGITPEEAYKLAMQAVPLGRMSEVDDIAGMVAWLISPDARGVTGQSLDMNGGAWM
ncbi:MAG: NAD(P)-dependent dehydrogenase (short-subunit alcohol dehydrogenase family) [Planctomycetota bacterium]|jgi:NAD(P)-dependent dehydrogenase (short-subunit alcohol dehydrogenase family)